MAGRRKEIPRRVELWTETLPDGRIRSVQSCGLCFEPIEARTRREIAALVRAQVPEGQRVCIRFADGSRRIINPVPEDWCKIRWPGP